MDMINFKYLPDYVFTKKFEKFVFANFHDFINYVWAARFFKTYKEIVRKSNIDSFEVYDINELDQLILYKIFYLNAATELEIAKDICLSNNNYMVTNMMRALITCPGNEICVYIERDLETVVIGCSEEVAGIFLNSNTGFIYNDLEKYIEYLDIIYFDKKNGALMLEIKERLCSNYSISA